MISSIPRNITEGERIRGRYSDIQRQIGRLGDGLLGVEGEDIVWGVDKLATQSRCGTAW